MAKLFGKWVQKKGQNLIEMIHKSPKDVDDKLVNWYNYKIWTTLLLHLQMYIYERYTNIWSHK